MRLAPLAGAAAATAIAFTGCGGANEPGSTKGAGALSWTSQPTLIAPGSKPRDRILFGEVRNDSLRPIRIRASKVRVVDARGRPLLSAVLFSRGYAHGLYGSSDPGFRDPGEFELTRLGKLVRLNPGQKAPLTVSWRLSSGAGRPAQIDFGNGALPIP